MGRTRPPNRLFHVLLFGIAMVGFEKQTHVLSFWKFEIQIHFKSSEGMFSTSLYGSRYLLLWLNETKEAEKSKGTESYNIVKR